MTKKACSRCGKEFAHVSGLSRHQKTCGQQTKVYSPHCNKAFSRQDNLKAHIKNSCKRLSTPAVPLTPGAPSIPLVVPPPETIETFDEPMEEEFSPLSGVEPLTSSPKRPLEEEPRPRKQYGCPHCGDTFRSFAARQRHVETDHAESLFQNTSMSDSSMNAIFDVLQAQDLSQDYLEGLNDDDLNAVFDQEIDHIAVGEYRRHAREQAVVEQQGGQLPLFSMQLNEIGARRRWRNAVQGAHFLANIVQQRDIQDADDVGLSLAEALYQAIRTELQQHPQATDINFSITSNSLSHPYQTVNLRVQEFMERNFRADNVFRVMAGKLNSNEEMIVDDGFIIDVNIISNPRPAGRPRKRKVGTKNLHKVISKKDCIIEIKNQDDLCVARSIVVMKAHADWQSLKALAELPDASAEQQHQCQQAFRAYENLYRKRDSSQRKQEQLAKELHQQAGVPEGVCGLEEWKQFQQTLTPEYQIQVLCGSAPFFLLYQGPEAPKKINLIKMGEHMNGCTSIPAFVNKSYWCGECGRGYDKEDAKNHPCEGRICKGCNRKDCPDYKMGVMPKELCRACNGLFYGPACLEAHRKQDICSKYKHCPYCSREYKVDPKKKHKCFHDTCRNCGCYVHVQKHKCFIQPVVEEEIELDEEGKPKKKPPLKPIFVYADIEAMIMPDRRFQVNLLRYNTSKDATINSHWGVEGCFDFLEDMDALTIVEEDDRERPVIILFHNLKGFDGLFIIHELYKQRREVTHMLTNGSKVMSFRNGSLTFKDSLCFLPIALEAFPKTFGLTELKKGYFPHAFNTPDHQDYCGPIPEASYYDPDSKKPEAKKAFETWHAEQVRRCEEEGYVFDFKHELEAYCHSDVLLLQQGCQAFAREFKQVAGFNPFEQCTTIASACNEFWRKHCLPENQITVEPLGGWRGAEVNQSLSALEWLAYVENTLPAMEGVPEQILHARNGGEQRLPTNIDPVHVDGYNPHTNTVYEFYGCLWHGCRKCYPRQRDARHVVNSDRTLNELYRNTIVKASWLRESGYQLVELWECQWAKMKRENPTIQRFVEQVQFETPLQPRDAFFGGRTGAVALYAQAYDQEEIRYADVTSLYPWVNKTQSYPIGHPQIISQPEQDIHQYFGIAKVTVLPPQELFHPVLPLKIKHQGMEKLTFPLCNQCVIDEQEKPLLDRCAICFHSDEQRQITGTWCTPEIEKALEKGYTLITVHEVWHFPEQRKGLFAEYVNTWLKIKQESAGWPRHCDTEEKKQAYLDKYEREEGIKLDREKIVNNPGRKQTAKWMLNSFWGKFGQKENKPKTVQFQSPHEFFQLYTDPTKEVSTIRICNDDVLEVVYTNIQENKSPSFKTNVFVAAFTTCWARLKLYSYLDQLQKQVLYYDTDSVVYKWNPGQPEIPTGVLLGQMTDELDGDIIEEFVSGGAKNYSYRTRQGKFECKVRGFSKNNRTQQVLNFNAMKNLILTELGNPLPRPRIIPVGVPNHFVRNSTKKTVGLEDRLKKYRLVFNKRVVDPETQISYPFGYYRDNAISLLMDLV